MKNNENEIKVFVNQPDEIYPNAEEIINDLEIQEEEAFRKKAMENGFMTNSQAQAYAEYALCAMVGKHQMEGYLIKNILSEMYWAFSLLTIEEVEKRAKHARGHIAALEEESIENHYEEEE